MTVVQRIARYKWQDVYVCKVSRHCLVSQLHSINNAWQCAVRLDYVRAGNVKLINVIVLNQPSLKQSPAINRHVKVIATCLDFGQLVYGEADLSGLHLDLDAKDTLAQLLLKLENQTVSLDANLRAKLDTATVDLGFKAVVNDWKTQAFGLTQKDISAQLTLDAYAKGKITMASMIKGFSSNVCLKACRKQSI